MGPNHMSQIEIGKETTNLEEGLPYVHLFVVHVADDHFLDNIHFLTIGMALEGYTSQPRKELVVRVAKFSFIVGNLYKMGADEILRRYVSDFELDNILTETHWGAVGAHYASKATAQKVLHACLW